MLIYSKINIFIRKFLLEHLNKDKKTIDYLLEKWDSHDNQKFLKEKFPGDIKEKKKNKSEAWNKFYKKNYPIIKRELGKKAKRKDIMGELSKRWKQEKKKPRLPPKTPNNSPIQETRIIEFEPIIEFPELIIPPDSSLHRLLTEMLKTEKSKGDETPNELPISPKSKKDLEEEETEVNSEAYDNFCEHNIDSIKEKNPELTYDKITKILARMWRSLSEEEKNEWYKS